MSSAKVFIQITDESSSWLDLFRNTDELEFVNDPQNTYESPENRAAGQRNTQKEYADYLVYVVTPNIQDFDIFHPLIDDSNKQSSKTVFFFLKSDNNASFNPHQVNSLNAIGKMVKWTLVDVRIPVLVRPCFGPSRMAITP